MTTQQPTLREAAEKLNPVETIRYWADAYSNPASGEHFMGHGKVVELLNEYTTLRAALAASQPEPCQAIGRHDPHCENRHQCWEPCGELGKSEEHAKVASQPEPKAGEPKVFKWWVEGHGSFDSRESAEAWAKEEGVEAIPLITLSAHREAMANLRKELTK